MGIPHKFKGLVHYHQWEKHGGVQCWKSQKAHPHSDTIPETRPHLLIVPLSHWPSIFQTLPLKITVTCRGSATLVIYIWSLSIMCPFYILGDFLVMKRLEIPYQAPTFSCLGCGWFSFSCFLLPLIIMSMLLWFSDSTNFVKGRLAISSTVPSWLPLLLCCPPWLCHERAREDEPYLYEHPGLEAYKVVNFFLDYWRHV